MVNNLPQHQWKEDSNANQESLNASTRDKRLTQHFQPFEEFEDSENDISRSRKGLKLMD